MSDNYTAENPNTGHGHVYPRPDGVVARCGGPRLCSVCAKDQARKDAENPPMPAEQVTEASNRRLFFGPVLIVHPIVMVEYGDPADPTGQATLPARELCWTHGPECPMLTKAAQSE